MLTRLHVVNCFKKCIFAVASTIFQKWMIWGYSCELLQKVYLCSSKHNLLHIVGHRQRVVNCFKKCIFAVASTIPVRREESPHAVVNCFKKCIFAVASTMSSSEPSARDGCELLQKVYLCSSKHNYIDAEGHKYKL